MRDITIIITKNKLFTMKKFNLTFDGVEYTIRLGIRTLMAYETMTSKSYTDIYTLADIVNFFYAALYSAGYGSDYDHFMTQLDDNIESFNLFVEEISSKKK